MCGICGAVGAHGWLQKDAMLSAMRHRGPDDEGTFEAAFDDCRIWLGHRRLAIIDLSSGGHQPMITRGTDTLALTFNGEIYNHASLRDQLRTAGHAFASTSDSEVLLAAWRQWGEHALGKLRGMFAFAIWDASEQVLWLARDRMGEKPLYYYAHSRGLLFASEIRTLLRSGLVPPALDPDGLESFLTFGSVSQPHTLIRRIAMLGPGQVLRYHDGHVTMRDYWTPGGNASPGLAWTRESAIAAVRQELDDAIRHCMVADVPVGVMLSGGVDSSAIVSRLAGLGYRDLSTFSVGFDGADQSLSEAEWARRAASRFGTDHHEVMVSADAGRVLLRDALAAVDQPSVDGFNHYLVLQAIAKAGYKVAITGQGADELFFGYSRHRQYAVIRALAHLRVPGVIRDLMSRALASTLPGSQRLQKSIALLGPGMPTALAYSARHSTFSGEELAMLLGRPVQSPTRFTSIHLGDSPLAGLYDLELRHFLPNQLLRDGDQMSMAMSLELRAPFLDHRLVELVAPMPTSLKILPGRQKPLLVDAVNDSFVTEMARRPKAGFPFPLARWIADESMDDASLLSTVGFDPAVVRRIIKRGRAARSPLQYFTLIVLARWMQANHVVAVA